MEMRHRRHAHPHVPQDAPGRRTLFTTLVLFALCVCTVALAGFGATRWSAVLGIILLVSGIVELIDAAVARESAKRAVRIGLAGLLPCLMALFLIFQIGLPTSAIALAFGIFFIVNGVFRGAAALFDRYPRWGWDVGYGVVGVVLGVIALANRNSETLTAIAWLLAIELGARAIVTSERDLAFRRSAIVQR
ncbi:MAG: DUF308 domain-containing protein [Myxococcaceae bacterium]|nr:DUF308 domain-containing protein [Myxococcaceae bacterium]